MPVRIHDLVRSSCRLQVRHLGLVTYQAIVRLSTSQRTETLLTRTPNNHHARLQSHPRQARLRPARHDPLHFCLCGLYPLVRTFFSLGHTPRLTLFSSRSLLVTFSAPFIKTIYFLSASNTNFGTFGFAQPTALVTSDSRLGYEYGTQVLSPLTSSMILWGIVDIFLFFQLMGVIPLLWVHDSQALHAVANSTFFTYSSVSLPICNANGIQAELDVRSTFRYC